MEHGLQALSRFLRLHAGGVTQGRPALGSRTCELVNVLVRVVDTHGVWFMRGFRWGVVRDLQ